MDNLHTQLERAEAAESELHSLNRLASEAPRLRAEMVAEKKQAERTSSRERALSEAKGHIEAANLKQLEVKQSLDIASKACFELFKTLRAIAQEKDLALEALSEVDHIDYLNELELEENKSGKAVTYSLASAIAVKHGEKASEKLLEKLMPQFDYFSGCDLSEKLFKDVGNFVLSYAVPRQKVTLPGQYQRPPREF